LILSLNPALHVSVGTLHEVCKLNKTVSVVLNDEVNSVVVRIVGSKAVKLKFIKLP